MDTCVIFCAGGFDGLIKPLDASDYVLAADGGYAHTQKLNIRPHGVLGDFDSLGYTPGGADVFPVEKDDTDAMLALRQGISMGYSRFLLYGSLDGPRLDHTVANLQALRFLAERGAVGDLVGLRQIASVVRNGTLRFPAGCRGYVSVFCLGRDAEGVSLSGLKYPLKDHTLSGSFPLGVSNHFVGTEAAITVTDGCLLVIYSRENGLASHA